MNVPIASSIRRVLVRCGHIQARNVFKSLKKMKLFIFVIFAAVVCASARPQWDLDFGGQGQAALGFATGVAAVPVAGLGGI